MARPARFKEGLKAYAVPPAEGKLRRIDRHDRVRFDRGVKTDKRVVIVGGERIPVSVTFAEPQERSFDHQTGMLRIVRWNGRIVGTDKEHTDFRGRALLEIEVQGYDGIDGPLPMNSLEKQQVIEDLKKRYPNHLIRFSD